MKSFYEKIAAQEDGCWIWYGARANNYGQLYFDGRAVLNETQVLEIRRLLESSDMLQYEIAEQFNVDPKTITNIKHRRQWRHI